MAERGGQAGNKNATKNKPWQKALERELTGERNADKLAAIAVKVVDMATNGDMPAIKEIGDRLDGKPMQAVELDIPPDSEVTSNIALARTIAFALDQAIKAKESDPSESEGQALH